MIAYVATSIVKGLKPPWDELLSDSDSDLDSADSLGEQEDDHTELQQILASIKTSVTCLFRLSIAVRNPAPESLHRSIITIDKSFFEEHDISHVRSKFPFCSSELVERLGRAITGRRQYFTYREEHHQKLTDKAELIGLEEPKSEHTNNSTVATPIPCAQPKGLNVLDGDEALSQTSYASSDNSGATIRVPPLPKEAYEHEHFECQYCFMVVSVHTKTAWKYVLHLPSRVLKSNIRWIDITCIKTCILTAVPPNRVQHLNGSTILGTSGSNMS